MNKSTKFFLTFSAVLCSTAILIQPIIIFRNFVETKNGGISTNENTLIDFGSGNADGNADGDVNVDGNDNKDDDYNYDHEGDDDDGNDNKDDDEEDGNDNKDDDDNSHGGDDDDNGLNQQLTKNMEDLQKSVLR